MKPHKAEHSAHADVQFDNPFAPVLHGSMAEAMEKSASLLGKGVRTLQQESVRFMTRRFEDNMKAAEQFGACRSLPDFLAAQQKWFADLAHAYSEEWARCSEIMTDVLQEEEKAGGNGRSERSPHTH